LHTDAYPNETLQFWAKNIFQIIFTKSEMENMAG
jgi:hypothetical protein